MNAIARIFYLILSSLLLIYVSLPNPEFPEPLEDSIRSYEPADVETLNRRGYYTDLSRDEVIIHYQEKIKSSTLLKLPLPTYRLNYPPEEAQILIRDQTKSSYLEEIVHPFRESFFVNGFVPREAKDVIEINGKTWQQKVIVKYVGSKLVARIMVTSISLFLFWIILKKWFSEFMGLVSIIKNLKILNPKLS